MSTSWQGDWQGRLQTELHCLGFSSLKDFFAAYPGLNYFKLVELIPDASIAPMQLYGEQLRDARLNNRLRETAADCLVRFLAYHIKRGWGQGRHFPFRLASAFADWKTSIKQYADPDETESQRLDMVEELLKANPPPIGWIPSGVSDSLIEKVFSIGWPESEQKGGGTPGP